MHPSSHTTIRDREPPSDPRGCVSPPQEVQNTKRDQSDSARRAQGRRSAPKANPRRSSKPTRLAPSSAASTSLIPSPPRDRLASQPPLLRRSTPAFPTTAAIPSSLSNNLLHSGEDVRPPDLSNRSPSINNHHYLAPNVATTSHASSPALPNVGHDSITQSPGLRTHSTPVFSTITELAKEYGIPQSLPPLPRTSARLPQPASPPADNTYDLCQEYLNMLSTEPTQSAAADDANVAAFSAVMQMLQGDPYTLHKLGPTLTQNALGLYPPASPEFNMATNDAEYLTSPYEESPLFDDHLTTPALGSDMAISPDIFTSPLMDFDTSYADMPLFADAAALFGAEPAKYTAQSSASASASAAPFSLEGLYTMGSPSTPALDPSSLQTSPATRDLDTMPPTPALPSLRRTQPTGTRRNITPAALIPLDAPIQPRTYVTPSRTSRKEVPASFGINKKRGRSEAFGEEEDDGEDVHIHAGMSEQEVVEAKRRQNTLAARRSRRRKLEYQQALEQAVHHWQSRALFLEGMLNQRGIPFPPASPAPL